MDRLVEAVHVLDRRHQPVDDVWLAQWQVRPRSRELPLPCSDIRNCALRRVWAIESRRAQPERLENVPCQISDPRLSGNSLEEVGGQQETSLATVAALVRLKRERTSAQPINPRHQ